MLDGRVKYMTIASVVHQSHETCHWPSVEQCGQNSAMKSRPWSWDSRFILVSSRVSLDTIIMRDSEVMCPIEQALHVLINWLIVSRRCSNSLSTALPTKGSSVLGDVERCRHRWNSLPTWKTGHVYKWPMSSKYHLLGDISRRAIMCYCADT